jgi:hypothetical protein
MTRYWFVFETSTIPSLLNLGCGVTARDLADALELVKARVFSGMAMPRIVGVIEDVPVASLEPRHVLPTMGPVADRGVWFPNLVPVGS